MAVKKEIIATTLSNLFIKSEPCSRFIKKHGKPILYIGGDRKDSFDFCIQNSIQAVFANLENHDEIPGVESIHSLEELQLKINSLIHNH